MCIVERIAVAEYKLRQILSHCFDRMNAVRNESKVQHSLIIGKMFTLDVSAAVSISFDSHCRWRNDEKKTK